jgi:hypothetical protein
VADGTFQYLAGVAFVAVGLHRFYTADAVDLDTGAAHRDSQRDEEEGADNLPRYQQLRHGGAVVLHGEAEIGRCSG